MVIRLLTALAALVLALPTAATAQVIIDPPMPPCPWWRCEPSGEVVVASYRLDVVVEDGVAVTRVRQVLRNDGGIPAEGEFLHPVPAGAAVTGMTLWIDGEPVSGELLDGEAARRTYEEIVRRTLDPALLEYADDGLLRLAVFPIDPGETRTVEIEYRQVLTRDGGLTVLRHPFGREHNARIEMVEAHVSIRSTADLKTVYSPSHDIGVNRVGDHLVEVGFEATGIPEQDFVLYWSADQEAVSLDVLTFAEEGEGWFLLLASPGLAARSAVLPKDVVIVLDVSGSMEGEKLTQAQDAARYVLSHLGEGDRFDVIAFSTGADSFGDGLRPAADAAAASGWIGSLAAAGSTNLDLALSQAVSRSGGGRPLYVLFLTDGLATEGVIDSPEILDRLDERAGDGISIFAFGVGYDVDTFLLDAVARDHHGTATYVTPDESIDAAVESLYSKVASPVLTDVSLDVDGVTVSDLYPAPLPDVFRGGQLVVAGRYEGNGTATVTLRGRTDGEPVEVRVADLAFSADGGDPSVPRIWAARKIGHLLTSIRLDGPDEETIAQIVRLSIRWGVVTPYTSYLVTEDAPFGAQALDDIARSEAERAAGTTLPPSGMAAVDAAEAAGDLAASATAGAPAPEYADLVRVSGSRTFRLSDGRWIDTGYEPGTPTVRVAFGSDDYFALATDPALAAALAVAPYPIVVQGVVTYEIVAADAPADPLPTTTAAATTTSPGSSTTTGPVAAPPGDEPGGSGFPVGPVVLGAVLAAAVALGVATRRRA